MRPKFFPEDDAAAGGGTGPKWDSPGTDVINSALSKSGIEFVEGSPSSEEPKAGEDKPVEEAEKPTDEKPAAEGEEKPKEAAEEVGTAKKYVIRGVEYTEEEIERSIRGGLREADYTRKNQENARERERLGHERDYLDRQRQYLESRARQLSPDARDAGADDPVEALLSDPEVPEPLAKAFRMERQRHRDEIARLERQTEERELRAQQDAIVDSAINTFEKTFADLCKKHSLTDPLLVELLHDHIVAKDPDIEDPEDLRASVERIFEHSHKGLEQHAERIRQSGIKKLADLPKAPPSTKGGRTMPLKPEGRPSPTLDDESAPGEFIERLDRLRGIGG